MTIPDSNFAKCITDQLSLEAGTPATLPVTEAQMASITGLGCTSARITDITGAEKLTNLTVLGLDSLPNMNGLQYTAANRISDLKPLAGLTGLQRIYLGHNLVSDLSPLAGLVNLIDLNLDANQITDLTPLARLINLTQQLGLNENQISDLTPLAKLTSLLSLDLSKNQVSNLAPLAGLTNLHYVFLQLNSISDLSPLAALPDLKDFKAGGQKLSLPTTTVGARVPLVVKNAAGATVPLQLPAGVTYADGAITSGKPGTYQITFSDGVYSSHYFMGRITQVVDPAPITASTPRIEGIAQVGSTLTALPGSWGPGDVALAYQWYKDSSAVAGAKGPAYVVQPTDVGSTLHVQVTGTADGVTAVTTKSAATAAVTKGVLSPAPVPVVSDTTPVSDQVLTADPGQWGPNPVSLAYQWYRVSSTGVSTAVSGATQASYTVKAGDVGYRLKVRIAASTPGYTTVAKYSAVTSSVSKASFSTCTAPAIADVGTPRVGKKLNLVPGQFDPVQSRFAYQWYRGTTAITGATGASYTLGSADKGQKVKVQVKAYRTGYYTVTQYTTPTVTVQAGLTAVSPKISDTTPTVDQKLTAIPGVWGPPTAGITFDYQWYQGTSAIPGATQPTYTVRQADVGAALKVKVTGNAADYANLSKTSAATTAVVKASFTTKPVPTISCPATCLFRVGETLTATPGGWTPTPDSYSYQWYRTGIAISGATKPTYTLTATDKGKTITVKVTARKAGYNTASKTSLASSGVTA